MASQVSLSNMLYYWMLTHKSLMQPWNIWLLLLHRCSFLTSAEVMWVELRNAALTSVHSIKVPGFCLIVKVQGNRYYKWWAPTKAGNTILNKDNASRGRDLQVQKIALWPKSPWRALWHWWALAWPPWTSFYLSPCGSDIRESSLPQEELTSPPSPSKTQQLQVLKDVGVSTWAQGLSVAFLTSCCAYVLVHMNPCVYVYVRAAVGLGPGPSTVCAIVWQAHM